MPSGGKRENAGRRKAERPTNAAVAERVLAQANAAALWLKIIETEKSRIESDPGKASTAGLRETLKYLECRVFGNCMDNVNHIHDKPLEMNVNVKLSEIIRGVRERKREYERNRE